MAPFTTTPLPVGTLPATTYIHLPSRYFLFPFHHLVVERDSEIDGRLSEGEKIRQCAIKSLAPEKWRRLRISGPTGDQ